MIFERVAKVSEQELRLSSIILERPWLNNHGMKNSDTLKAGSWSYPLVRYVGTWK